MPGKSRHMGMLQISRPKNQSPTMSRQLLLMEIIEQRQIKVLKVNRRILLLATEKLRI